MCLLFIYPPSAGTWGAAVDPQHDLIRAEHGGRLSEGVPSPLFPPLEIYRIFLARQRVSKVSLSCSREKRWLSKRP